MKKRTLLIAMLLLAGSAMGQDAELQSLVSIVKSLRTNTQGSYNKAQSQLSQDLLWTTMAEIRDSVCGSEYECARQDNVVPFKLNSILNNTERRRKPVASHGDMLNGKDSRYPYSLYELSIRGQASVTYNLTGRHGRQTFVIVTHSTARVLSVSVRIGSKVYDKCSFNDGVLTIECDTPNLSPQENISITVRNTSKINQAFVIINHNNQSK